MSRNIFIALALAVLAAAGWLTARFLTAPKDSGMIAAPFPAESWESEDRSAESQKAEPQTGPAAVSRESFAAGTKNKHGREVSEQRPSDAPRENYTSETSAKLAVLEEILDSKNDNDPRLDRDFNGLSPETKRLFRKKYRGLKPELRNEQGAIVHLLGKNLKSAEDWAFLREVAGAPPCLSLADCSKEMPSTGDHRELGMEITLAYPSMVALNIAERVLDEAGSAGEKTSPAFQEAVGVINAAKNSDIPVVSKKAEELGKKF